MSAAPDLLRASKRVCAVLAFGSALALASCYVPVRAEGDFGLIVRPPIGAATWFAAPLAKAEVRSVVISTARRFGVPEHVADYHARRESGYRANARNPKSTATGVLQVVKGSHEAIIGRRLTLQEHVRMMSDPAHGSAVGLAHIAACMESRPNWTPGQLWRSGHVAGLRSCGTSLEHAARLYRERG